jgi:DNA-binding response OmpR family regulator
MKVLLVDDDATLRRTLGIGLRAEGHEVLIAADGRSALQALREDKPDIVVLDLGLPDLSGVEVLRRLRAWSTIPVVVLSARAESTEKVQALDLGADDYVTKPFSVAELVSRVAALLRRRRIDAADHAPMKLEVDGLLIDPRARTVERDGTEVRLTTAEFDLLLLLAESPGQVFTRQSIMEHLWKTPFFGDQRSADTHIANIRRKIERDPTRPSSLQTVRGVGYKLGARPKA